ncbi:alkaline phosphatase [Gracilaria domingensis]|nr:alkaline phosphatase [Gracilaria domingensis]
MSHFPSSREVFPSKAHAFLSVRVSMNFIFILASAALCTSVLALQRPERHFGCPPGKNVCVYPIDDANLQCETVFDFQVALHVPLSDRIDRGVRQAMDIKITVPSGDVLTPEMLFGREPELRNWTLGGNRLGGGLLGSLLSQLGAGTLGDLLNQADEGILADILGQADGGGLEAILGRLGGESVGARLGSAGGGAIGSTLSQIGGEGLAALLSQAGGGGLASLLGQAAGGGLATLLGQAAGGSSGALNSQAGGVPEGFNSYALMYRNVVIDKKYGKGPVKVTVSARGVTTEVTYVVREPTKRRARNVVLLIGDGMSLPMMAAARLVSRGMVHGKYNDLLHMEKLPYFGIQSPAGVDSIITDSANAGTSMNTGQKSSSDALGVYADSGDDDFAHPKQETIAEYIKRKFDMSVGVVTTAEIQDATPAAVWAHVRRRAEKAAITAQAINGCRHCLLPVRPDVIMGGGGSFFRPDRSIDGSNMYSNYSAVGYTVTHTRAEMLAAAEDANTKKLLTVSHNGNMEVWLDRNVYTDNLLNADNSPTADGPAPVDQPNLDEMVMSAIKVLSKNENGFYLMVEAASIDKSAHPLDVPRTLSDLIELDNTVGQVKAWAKENGDDTLIIATSDHGHGFDVFGTVDTKIWDDAVSSSEEKPVSDVDNYCGAVVDNDGTFFNASVEETSGMTIRESNRARRTAIGTHSNAGYPDYIDSDGDGFPDTWDVRTTLAAGMNNFPDHTEDYRVSSSVKIPAVLTRAGFLNNPADDPNGIFLSGNISPIFNTGVHTMQDVGVFGYGPGAEQVRGVMDNTEIFHIIASALGFGTGGTMTNYATVARLGKGTPVLVRKMVPLRS